MSAGQLSPTRPRSPLSTRTCRPCTPRLCHGSLRHRPRTPSRPQQPALGRDDVLVYLAYLGDEPVGYAYAQVRRHPETSLQYAFDEIYLHHLSVLPSLRGRGIGGALLGAVRQAADDRDIRQVALDVWSFNERAEAFFRRHGFEAYNERLWLR